MFRRFSLAAFFVSATLAGTAALAAGAVDHFDIPAGDLATALDRFAEQSGLQIVQDQPLVKGINTKPLSGTYTPEQALNQLLQNSGLSWDYVDGGTIVLRRMPAAGAPKKKAEASAKGAERSDSDQEEIATVEVTGTRLSRTTEGPVPVNVYTREDILKSGQTTVADFFNTLPEVSLGTPEAGPVFSGQTTVRLRGLPLGTTLLLINGRRVDAGAGTAYYGGYFDLNNLPSSIIERVEIVPEGSSAIYGSDALAGVVNIVTRQDFSGVQANAHYGFADGTEDRSADLSWGKLFERGSVSLVGTYYQRTELSSDERPVTSDLSHGVILSNCNPGNVYSVDGGNLPGLSAASAGVRVGVHDDPTVGDFNAGQLNACRYEPAAITPAERVTFMGSGHYEFSPAFEAFAELLYTHQRQWYGLGHRSLYSVTVPASNAYNPFGEDVLVNYRFSGDDARYGDVDTSDFFRPLVGIRGKLGGDWEWETTVWQSGAKMDNIQRAALTDTDLRTAALASSDPATALNLFTSGSAASSEILDAMFPDDIYTFRNTSRFVNAFARGSLFELPSGPVKIVVGGEYNHNELKWTSPTTADSNFDYKRELLSAFGELRIPLIANRSNPAAGDVLALSGAVRYDHDQYFGSHTTPQYALEFRPIDSILVRGAYAEAFKAPGLNFINSAQRAIADSCCVIDPTTGESVPYTYAYGGNPNLKPETGKSTSVGLVWSPTSVRGLETSVTWWQIEQRDRIASLSAQTVVDNEALFPNNVTRDPDTGAIETVHVGYLNFGQMNVSGVDFDAKYAVRTVVGQITPALRVSEMYRYDAALTPGAPQINRLARASSDAWGPRWKGTLSLAWAYSYYSADVAGRYVSSYLDYQTAGATNRQLGNFWYWDLSGKYALGQALMADNPYLANSYVQVSAVNLFDTQPRYSADYNGYDATQYDIRGRFVSLNLGVRF